MKFKNIWFVGACAPGDASLDPPLMSHGFHGKSL